MTIILRWDGEKYMERRPCVRRRACSALASSSVSFEMIVTCLPFKTSARTCAHRPAPRLSPGWSAGSLAGKRVLSRSIQTLA